MRKSIYYFKQLTAAEVGVKGTHEIYVRLPNDFNHEEFFQSPLEVNDRVLEKIFVAKNLTIGHEGEEVQLRYVYFHNSNKEKRIPSMGDVFQINNVQENDVVKFESRIVDDNVKFYITFLKSSDITLNPKQFYYCIVNNDEEHLEKSELQLNKKLFLQQIFYGAPGTGKSHTIKEQTEGKDVVRTTFHPDSDYSTFVGAYKPTTKTVPMTTVIGTKAVAVEDADGKPMSEDKIVYEFVSQAFLQAYVAAWEKYAANGEETEEEYLIIEEINRGNCAQIFGDLFQLLDRGDEGFSEYPIKADADMKKQLAKKFAGLEISNKEKINSLFKEDKDVVAQVLNGEILLLPSNLYIWATMNTSDQSLFPIDSAFKRRWDWKYVPISDAKKNWVIEVNGSKYDWWQFLDAINTRIYGATFSEDKKLGYFFCKADGDVISAEKFVSKVIFYLWNDVFKDSEFEGDAFNDDNGEKLSFDKFYSVIDNETKVNEEKVELFLKNLGVTPVATSEPNDDEEYFGQKESTDETMKSEWSETEKKRYVYWDAFLKYAPEQSEDFAKYFGGVKKASKDHWKNFFISGMRDFYLVAIQQRRKQSIEIQVYFDKTTDVFYKLSAHKDEIEHELGAKYSWRENPNKKASIISEEKQNIDFENKEKWHEQFNFIIDRLLRMRETFLKYSRDIE